MTRWPGAGQWIAGKRHRPARFVAGRARLISDDLRRAARRAPGGPRQAEPGAEAGPGAAQRRHLYRWLLGKHIAPSFGNVPIGKITTQAVRQWRAELISSRVSATMAAKAYRLMRATLATAVEDDKLLPRNPCRIRGGGSEHSAERPVLTVGQVFELAHLVGRRPIGNVRRLPDGGYRLRCRSRGEMRPVPGVYATKALAEEAPWAMAQAGEADCRQDDRYRALVLLAAFASLRWGEVTALRRAAIIYQHQTRGPMR